MARYGKEHKEATRRRIVEAAGTRLKRDGIDGSGVSVLMADAGLTNGAFYAHFTSKEDLVATTVADQLRQQLERYCAAPSGREGVERLVREYLSIEHRDDSEHGCPSAALLDEIGRCSSATKHAYTAGVLTLVDEIASRLAPGDPQSARRTDAQPVRAADRHSAALPRPRRPTPRRRGTRAGHRQRADAPPQRLAPRLHRTRRRSPRAGRPRQRRQSAVEVDRVHADSSEHTHARRRSSLCGLTVQHEVGNEAGGVVVGAGDAVAVHVERGRGSGVAEALGDGHDGDAVGEHLGGHEVP